MPEEVVIPYRFRGTATGSQYVSITRLTTARACQFRRGTGVIIVSVKTNLAMGLPICDVTGSKSTKIIYSADVCAHEGTPNCPRLLPERYNLSLCCPASD